MNVKKIKRSFKSFGHAYKAIDMYGQTIELNFKGEDTINSHAGSTVSLIVVLLMLAYTSYRFSLLVTYGNTNVTDSKLDGNFDSSYILDLSTLPLNMAFGLI